MLLRTVVVAVAVRTSPVRRGPRAVPAHCGKTLRPSDCRLGDETVPGHQRAAADALVLSRPGRHLPRSGRGGRPGMQPPVLLPIIVAAVPPSRAPGGWSCPTLPTQCWRGPRKRFRSSSARISTGRDWRCSTPMPPSSVCPTVRLTPSLTHVRSVQSYDDPVAVLLKELSRALRLPTRTAKDPPVAGTTRAECVAPGSLL